MDGAVEYGVLGYSTDNIGDDIQSIASSRFLPSIDQVINRERLHRFDGPRTKVILNAFFLDSPKHFPPSDRIDPLLISMHVTPVMRKGFIKRSKEYLIEHGPVGCRDMTTLRWLEENDVPAYFSGCLTTTLMSNPEIEKQDYIIATDLPDEVVEYMRSEADCPVYTLSHDFRPVFDMRTRLEAAKVFLYLYNSARCVVSRRLHASVPSLAMGTPSLLLDIDLERFGGRFEGVREHVRQMSVEDFLDGKYDINSPPPNPTSHMKIRNDLVKRCAEFTGYDSGRSSVTVPKIPEIMWMLRNNENDHRRMFYKYWKKESLEMFFDKYIRGRRAEDMD